VVVIVLVVVEEEEEEEEDCLRLPNLSRISETFHIFLFLQW
jgi:hypothetical protein